MTTSSQPATETRGPSLSSPRSQPFFLDKSRPLTLPMIVEMGLVNSRSLDQPLPPDWPEGELFCAATSSTLSSSKVKHDIIALYEHRKIYELQWMLWKVASTFGFVSYQHPSTNEIIPLEDGLEEDGANHPEDPSHLSGGQLQSTLTHHRVKKRGVLPHRHLQKIMTVSRGSDTFLYSNAVSPYVSRMCANRHLQHTTQHKASFAKNSPPKPKHTSTGSLVSDTRRCGGGALVEPQPPLSEPERGGRSSGKRNDPWCTSLSFSSSSTSSSLSSSSSSSDFSTGSSSLTSAHFLEEQRLRHARGIASAPVGLHLGANTQPRFAGFHTFSATSQSTPPPQTLPVKNMYEPLKLTLMAAPTASFSASLAVGAGGGFSSMNEVQRGYSLTTPFSLSEMPPERAGEILNLPSYAQSHQMNLEAMERERSCYKDPVTGCLVLTSGFLQKFPNCGGELCKHCPHGIVCSRMNGADRYFGDDSSDDDEEGDEGSDEDWWNSSDSLSVASIFDELLEPVEG